MDEIKAKEGFLRERSKRGEQSRYSEENQLKSYKKRLLELDMLIQTAFEERVLKSMPEHICKTLCEKYQSERENLQRLIAELESQLFTVDKYDVEAEEYVKKLKSYFNCENLTRETCLQLIDCITVSETAESDGERDVHIYYKFQND